AKRMELLKEAVPKAALIAILWNAGDRGMTLRYREIEKAARALQVEVQAVGMRGPEDFPAAFESLTRRKPDAIFLVSDALTNVNRKQFIDFAAAQRIPTMYELGVYVREGEAERTCRVRVEDVLALRRLLDGEPSGIGTCDALVGVDRRSLERDGDVGRTRHQPTCAREFAEFIDGRNGMRGGKADDRGP